MLYKTLKHKTLPDTFGFITDGQVYKYPTPAMYKNNLTMESLQKSYRGYSRITDELEDYELVDVEVIIKPLKQQS